jgi:hypothetical protein
MPCSVRDVTLAPQIHKASAGNNRSLPVNKILKSRFTIGWVNGELTEVQPSKNKEGKVLASKTTL